MDKKFSLLLILYILLTPLTILYGLKIAGVKSTNGLNVQNLTTGFEYATIQEAINANTTLNGHTIFVKEGTYIENVVVNKSLHLMGKTREATIIDGNNTASVFLIESDFVTITNFTIRGSGCCGDRGIHVKNATYITITNNTIAENNGFGIEIEEASNVTVSGNIIIDNFSYGIQLLNSSDNKVDHNIVMNNSIGMTVKNSVNNTIAQNIVSSCLQIGIHLEFSQGNTIINNNIFDNLIPITNINAQSSFDMDSEGNYWGDYTGEDLDHNGIGDTPYTIDAFNNDNYPLMGMFHSFIISPEKQVSIISNSSVKEFRFFESNNTLKLRVNATEGQTNGFCRITIPQEVIASPFNITINGSPKEYKQLFEDETQSIIYFNYEHSELEIVIVHELELTIVLITMLISVIAITKHRSACAQPQG